MPHTFPRVIVIVLDSGAHEDCAGDCHIRFYSFGWTLICELPRIVRDYRERHNADTWSAETIARMGRDWYEVAFPCEYGVTFSERALHVYYGAQTHSSCTTKSWCCFLPWLAWRYVRMTLYTTTGAHFWTERAAERGAWEAMDAVRTACPKARFDFEDYDGERITATTHIEEREWRLGERPFRWLSWFRRPRIRRDLSIKFSAEVGPEKGSWKGGTTEHSIEMLPGESCEAAFARYCTQEHRAKYRRFNLRYIGRTPATPAAAT